MFMQTRMKKMFIGIKAVVLNEKKNSIKEIEIRRPSNFVLNKRTSTLNPD
jgi:hypothetical protein